MYVDAVVTACGVLNAFSWFADGDWYCLQNRLYHVSVTRMMYVTRVFTCDTQCHSCYTEGGLAAPRVLHLGVALPCHHDHLEQHAMLFFWTTCAVQGVQYIC